MQKKKINQKTINKSFINTYIEMDVSFLIYIIICLILIKSVVISLDFNRRYASKFKFNICFYVIQDIKFIILIINSKLII